MGLRQLKLLMGNNIRLSLIIGLSIGYCRLREYLYSMGVVLRLKFIYENDENEFSENILKT